MSTLSQLIESIKDPKKIAVLEQTAKYLAVDKEPESIIHNGVMVYKDELTSGTWIGYIYRTKEGQWHGDFYYKHYEDGRINSGTYQMGKLVTRNKIKGVVTWKERYDIDNNIHYTEIHCDDQIIYSINKRNGCIETIRIYEQYLGIIAEYQYKEDGHDTFVIKNINKSKLNDIIRDLMDHANIEINYHYINMPINNQVIGILCNNSLLAINRKKLIAIINALNPLKDASFD